MFPFFLKSRKRRKLVKEGLASSKTRLKEEQTFAHKMDNSKFLRIIILTIVWFSCALVLILPSDSKNKLGFYLVLNQQAPKTVYADFSFLYLDKTATKLKKNKAAESVPLIYEINSSECKNILSKSNKLLDEISLLPNIDGTIKNSEPKKNSKDQSENIKADVDQQFNKLNLSKSSIATLYMISKDPQKRTLFNEQLSNILYKGIISGKDHKTTPYEYKRICILDSKLKHIRPPQFLYTTPTPNLAAENFATEVAKDYSPQNRRQIKSAIYKFALLILNSTITYNKDLTSVEKSIVIKSLKNEVYKEVTKGNIIIRKGAKITPTSLERFNAYVEQKHKNVVYQDFWENFCYYIIMSLLLIIIIAVYLYYLHPKILRSNQKLGTIATVIIISVLSILFADKIFHWFALDYNLPESIKTCFIPLGLTSILLSSLIGLRAATFASLLVALVAAIKLDSYFVVILSMGISSIAGFVVHEVKNYKEYYIKAVLSVSILFITMEFFGQLKLILMYPDILPWIAGLSVLNGFLTATASLAILFVIESVFKISTDMSLLSLCDYNHPLLKKLQIEAPGTYHHCLIVANLAEQAASAIGANPIQARVCALFHDIGKLSKPDYYTENNIYTKNRHNMLRPGMSCMIIMNHVKEGVNSAIKYKLNKLIRDAIQQHHGTDLVYFFYRRAIAENNNTTKGITESEYRYPGPKPHKKEIVVVSLADACEAASRSLSKPTPSKIETLISEIFRKRISEGQLDCADLTFWELAETKKSFIKTLNSMFHTRITYPSEEKNDHEGDLFHAAKERSEDSEKKVSSADEKNSTIR